ncbi:SCND3 protein, partial [Acromyrmex heyeri]
MKMSRTKCTNIITNVLSPVETERVVNNIQNTKFTIFIDETSDICNDKWMTFLVRYIEPKTLDNRTQLVKLIDIDARDCSTKKLYEAFRNEMWTLQILFTNIVVLSCDNASVMTGKHLSFKKKLEQVCLSLLTFSCPCHSSALVANAACNKIPDFCEEFIKKIARYINSSPKRSAVFTEFYECFQEKSLKILKLCDTRWFSRYFCVERLLEYWDTIRYFLYEIVVSEKAGPAKDLLFIMDNVETKAYFLFLQYILDLFNKFNAHFQSLQTRIHELQPKSLTLLLLRPNPWKFGEGEWRGYGRTVRLNFTGICAEANTCESYAPFQFRNMSQRPKERYDTCSWTVRTSYFWVKELNPFDPGLDLVRSQVEGKECEW